MSGAFSVLPGHYGVCRLESGEDPPGWATSGPFSSVTRTPDELSVVCRQEGIPAGIQGEKGFRLIRVSGPLDFSLTGVIASISRALALAGIALFVVSTYDTDYILVRDRDLEGAVAALTKEGWSLDRRLQ